MPPLYRAFVCLVAISFAAIGLAMPMASVRAAEPLVRVASGPPIVKSDADAVAEKELTPEQKMQKRFPHPVRVGDLIGLPVLDDDDSTIGYVRQVVRSPDGKISLIVPYSARFGWVHTEWGKRAVAVPIETVVILARQLDAVDMPRSEFDEAPTWTPSEGQVVGADEKTLIGLGRR
jgi:hypothetical protein